MAKLRFVGSAFRAKHTFLWRTWSTATSPHSSPKGFLNTHAVGAAGERAALQNVPPGSVVLRIYDFTGRMVHTSPISGEQVLWDGRDQIGRMLAYGIYFYEIAGDVRGPSILGNESTPLFEDVTSSTLPDERGWTRDVEVGDLDGDGDLDVMLAPNMDAVGLQPQVLINSGDGKFVNETAGRLPELAIVCNDVDLSDVDGDGDLDVYFANATRAPFDTFSDRLLINDGFGHFTDETEQRLTQSWFGTQNVAFGDLDGDDDNDLVVVGAGQDMLFTVFLLLNDGAGNFADSTQNRITTSDYFPFDLALTDIDNDDDLDLVLANFSMTFSDENGNIIGSFIGQNAIFVNQGDNTFIDETSVRHPVIVEDLTVEIVAGDLDGDGDLDLFFDNAGFPSTESLNRLLINSGDGIFTDESAQRLPIETVTWNNHVVLADFNRDNALDIFMPSVRPGEPAPDLLYLNDGSGHFIDRSQEDLPAIIDFSATAAGGNVDNDDDTDLFIGNITSAVTDSTGAMNRLYTNQTLATAVAGRSGNESPVAFDLLQSHPNPFSHDTAIRFQLPVAGQVQLSIIDAAGRVVRTLANARYATGAYRVQWNGRDEYGRTLPSGVYFYRLQFGEFSALRKLTLVR